MLYIRAGYIKEKLISSVYNDPLEAMGNIFGKRVTKDDDVIVYVPFIVVKTSVTER